MANDAAAPFTLLWPNGLTTPTVSAPGTPEFGVTFALTAVLASETPAPEAPAATWPVRVWARLVDPVSGRLAGGGATERAYVPACACQAFADADHEARSWTVSGKDTVALAPGLRLTRWKPLSCLGGSWLAAG